MVTKAWKGGGAAAARVLGECQWVVYAVLLGAGALALRLMGLESLPSGLHGDEAIAGLEAKRIIDEGWIGVYSPHAAGQPAGPLYVFAAAVWVFGDGVAALRAVSAVAGSATVGVLFLVLRPRLGLAGALVAAVLLATMVWHIHYSRIAFPIAFWPLTALIAQYLVVRAFETRDRRYWAAAGAVTAFGVYVYNAHWMFGGAIAIAGGVYLLLERSQLSRRDYENVAIAGACALVVLLPILRLTVVSSSVYTSHFERDSYLQSAEWQQTDGPVERVTALGSRYTDVWLMNLGEAGSDSVDAAGVVSLVSLPLAMLAAWGLAVGWRRRTTRWWWLTCLCILLLMPLGTVLTIDAVPRRSFVMTLALAIFAGIAVANLLARYRAWSGLRQSVLLVGCAMFAGFGPVGLMAGIHSYFVTFAESPQQAWVFARDFTDVSLYLDRIDESDRVILWSGRHSIHYETRQYLAPDVRGTDFGGTVQQFLPEVLGNDVIVVIVDAHPKLTNMLVAMGGEVVVPRLATGFRYSVLCLRCSSETLERVPPVP